MTNVGDSAGSSQRANDSCEVCAGGVVSGPAPALQPKGLGEHTERQAAAAGHSGGWGEWGRRSNRSWKPEAASLTDQHGHTFSLTN